MLNTTIENSKTADFLVIHFNGANRTYDKETTDATSIHPVSKECEASLTLLAKKHNLTVINGVAILQGLGSAIIDKLLDLGFIDHTTFTDELTV